MSKTIMRNILLAAAALLVCASTALIPHMAAAETGDASGQDVELPRELQEALDYLDARSGGDDAAAGNLPTADGIDADMIEVSPDGTEGSANASASGASDADPYAWGAGGDFSDMYVVDMAGVLSESEYLELMGQAQQMSEKYGLGVYFLTTDYMDGLPNPTSSQRTRFATNFYKRYNFGLGEGHNGIMFVVAVDSRDYVTIAYGSGSYDFNDAGIEYMEDKVTDKLHDSKWYQAAQEYYRQVGVQLEYYFNNGKPGGRPLDFEDWLLRIFLILGIPFAVAFVFVRSQIASMKSTKESGEARTYLDPASVVLTAAQDTFVNTTITSTPKNRGGSGSGGGGGWGGGGGGGFSSSGGGKF